MYVYWWGGYQSLCLDGGGKIPVPSVGVWWSDPRARVLGVGGRDLLAHL